MGYRTAFDHCKYLSAVIGVVSTERGSGHIDLSSMATGEDRSSRKPDVTIPSRRSCGYLQSIHPTFLEVTGKIRAA